jgi:4-amino-4-deoxy-L-arabinose transferase-like glycosyltransferase
VKPTLKHLLIVIFLIGAAVRLADMFRPINQSSWRESDVGAIARNFSQESMNIFYPRIDWRGTTPGYAEMEFPLYPYAVAATYSFFGVNDVFGRVWSFLFSLAALFLFFGLAREFLDGFPLVAAVSFFAFNPLILEFSTAIQPEGLMIALYVGSVLFLMRWLRTEHGSDFWIATIFTALALLSKLTAAHVGIMFAFVIVSKFGLGAFRDFRVWLFGLIAVIPAAAWYMHGKGFWYTYGNSLGVSNEYHWIGYDFFTNPYFITGILKSEAIWVWSVTGIVIGVLAFRRGFRDWTVSIPLVWLGACALFYLVTARTSADGWAAYYHIFSVPPAAVLFGAGIRELIGIAREWAAGFSARSVLATYSQLFGVAALLAVAGSVFAADAVMFRSRILENRKVDESFECAARIKPYLKEPGLILASGDICFDRDGYEVAFNTSFMFYWLERKGFNICVERQSIATVREVAASGAVYYVAQRSIMKQKPEFESELRDEFNVVTECGEFVVFDLREAKLK